MTIYFHLFEIFVYFLFAICFAHALLNNLAGISWLVWGALYGIALEIATIYQLSAYEYGQFNVMVFNVPLCIGVAWGCIIYAANEICRKIQLSVVDQSVLAGLLGLGIDLGLDVIAVRLGFWDWGRGLQHQYFGVPYGNFWAWFWVIVGFTFAHQILQAKFRTSHLRYLIGPLALIGGLIGVYLTNGFIKFVVPDSVRPWVVLLTLVASVIFISRRYATIFSRPFDKFGVHVLMAFNSLVLLFGLISGVLLTNTLMLVIGLFIHFIYSGILYHNRLNTYRFRPQS